MKAEERFDGEVARKYDRGIRVSVPAYEELHRMTRHLLRLDLEERARVLVVGAGTGAEIAGLGKQEPGWSLTGVDPSPDMISVASGRVAEGGLAHRAALRVGYVHDLPASQPYDAATAILVMHFLPDDGQKLDLLRGIAARLRPGAHLVLADLCGDPASGRFARFIAAWRLRQRALGMEEKDVEAMFEEMLRAVHFIPEERIVALMREAGFEGVERFYNALLFGGWTSRKTNDTTALHSAWTDPNRIQGPRSGT